MRTPVESDGGSCLRQFAGESQSLQIALCVWALICFQVLVSVDVRPDIADCVLTQAVDVVQ
jgi:hypothetical protein